jgi:hypothetical protein
MTPYTQYTQLPTNNPAWTLKSGWVMHLLLEFTRFYKAG